MDGWAIASIRAAWQHLCFDAQREGCPFPSPDQIVEIVGPVGKGRMQTERNEIPDKADNTQKRGLGTRIRPDKHQAAEIGGFDPGDQCMPSWTLYNRSPRAVDRAVRRQRRADAREQRYRSEEHTSELQSPC